MSWTGGGPATWHARQQPRRCIPGRHTDNTQTTPSSALAAGRNCTRCLAAACSRARAVRTCGAQLHNVPFQRLHVPLRCIPLVADILCPLVGRLGGVLGGTVGGIQMRRLQQERRREMKNGRTSGRVAASCGRRGNHDERHASMQPAGQAAERGTSCLHCRLRLWRCPLPRLPRQTPPTHPHPPPAAQHPAPPAPPAAGAGTPPPPPAWPQRCRPAPPSPRSPGSVGKVVWVKWEEVGGHRQGCA